MRRSVLMHSALSCALLLALDAGASVACSHASAACNHATPACCAKAAPSAATFVPLPSSPLPAAPAPLALLPSASDTPVVAGLMAFLDPETGRLSGPIGQLQVPMDQLQAEAAMDALVPVTMPDGSVMLDLRGTAQDYLVLHVDALGHRTIQCVPDPRQAAPFVNLPASMPYAER